MNIFGDTFVNALIKNIAKGGQNDEVENIARMISDLTAKFIVNKENNNFFSHLIELFMKSTDIKEMYTTCPYSFANEILADLIMYIGTCFIGNTSLIEDVIVLFRGTYTKTLKTKTKDLYPLLGVVFAMTFCKSAHVVQAFRELNVFDDIKKLFYTQTPTVVVQRIFAIFKSVMLSDYFEMQKLLLDHFLPVMFDADINRHLDLKNPNNNYNVESYLFNRRLMRIIYQVSQGKSKIAEALKEMKHFLLYVEKVSKEEMNAQSSFFFNIVPEFMTKEDEEKMEQRRIQAVFTETGQSII
ncbi:hypothetical protein EIN_407590 [Entamoeba invadens IP1]|uniref:Uncharacterized protein n=1 Tax=Entamoeba invadens IP1 TaxID=370355 RepID=A0A0A1TZC4_ENTIV|nr:hypothetical protein EIN_407590 [Entamoeba invadens IP1]ELP85560.1 hypothetical protein EIN_407590 [Entamoeba invadens IP1]|eukprot:XP_004184906.1 hypothetical protein EIN_407590 [Entamoeba invadens IP1]